MVCKLMFDTRGSRILQLEVRNQEGAGYTRRTLSLSMLFDTSCRRALKNITRS